MTKKIVVIVAAVWLAGIRCAVQQPVVEVPKVSPKIPVGVDARVAQIADSIFSQVAVDYEMSQQAFGKYDEAQQIEELADSLWQYGQAPLLTKHDSLTVLRQISQAEPYLERRVEDYHRIRRLIKRLGRLDPEVRIDVSKQLMTLAIEDFESAIQSDRFYVPYHQQYCKLLQKVAERLGDKNYLNRAAEQMERVVFFVKGQHILYANLAEIYFKLGDWNNAYKNFEAARNTLIRSAIFSLPNPQPYFTRLNEVPVDTHRVVTYLNWQAVCKTKLYEAQPALALYRQAQRMTSDIDLKRRFQERIDWILWDDGNIRASEIKEKGDSLRVVAKDYLDAKKIYLESLLPILWTKRTKDEINWRIALLDFVQLGNKAEGVQRLCYVIKYSPVDSLTGAPLDSNYVRYFNDYGNMCFNLGNEYYEKDKLIAYIYFQQAAATNYKERGKAFLRLAQISEFDPKETIDLCQKTIQYENELDKNEKIILYKVMHNAYRKLGDFKNARFWFDKFNGF